MTNYPTQIRLKAEYRPDIVSTFGMPAPFPRKGSRLVTRFKPGAEAASLVLVSS